MSEKRLNRRDFLRMGALTAAGTVLAACGPAPTPEVVEVERVVTQEVEKVVEVEKEVKEVVTVTPGGITKGGTLTIAMDGDTKTLDPHDNQLWVWVQMRRQVFEQLLEIDAETLELAPRLATEWEWEDEKTLAMKVREDVRFHNGEPFTAEDVKFSVDRVIQPDYPSQFNQRFDKIDSVEVRGPYDVVFHLKEKDPGVTYVFADFDIVCKSIPQDKFATTCVGTGPFRFVEWKPNEHLIEERNPDYWQPDLPRVDNLVFKVIPQRETRLASLLAGDVDADNQTALKDVARLATTTGIEVTMSPPLAHGVVIYTNIALPETSDLRVRQAMLYALDRKTLCETLYAGLAEPANTPVGPGNPAYNPDVDELYPYDPEKAEQLLAEAGYPGGKGLTVQIVTHQRRVEISEFLQNSLMAVGIDAKLELLEQAAWSNRLRNERTAHLAFDGYSGGWNSPFALYRSAHFFRPGPTNGRGFVPGMVPEYEEALAAADKELDPAKSIELWKKVQALWLEYLPAGFMVLRDSQAQAHQDYVKDYRFFPMPRWEYAWLDK